MGESGNFAQPNIAGKFAHVSVVEVCHIFVVWGIFFPKMTSTNGNPLYDSGGDNLANIRPNFRDRDQLYKLIIR